MPLNDFINALKTIPPKEKVKNFHVVLTGGEPLLRPDIEETGRQLCANGCHWGMVSNGYFYTAEKQKKLLQAGMESLTISLDGLKESHDWMRGKNGSYNHAIEAISLAAKEKRLSFDVVTCVNKRNIGELSEIYDSLNGLGVRQWRIFTIIPIGRAKNEPDLHLSNTQFVELMEFIKTKREQQNQQMRVTFSCEGYLGRYECKVRNMPFFCHAGINIASVLIDGRISACPNIDRDRFSQGNIYTDNFFEVWNNRFEPFRNRNWAKKGKCKDCKVFNLCLGNGMHNWHGSCDEVLNCHYRKTIEKTQQ